MVPFVKETEHRPFSIANNSMLKMDTFYARFFDRDKKDVL
jgi:hypothetical protein